MQITFTEHLKGRTVLDSGGRVLGSLEELLVDDSSWQVEAFRIRLDRAIGGDIGAPRGVFHAATLDIPRTMVKAASDAVILSVPLSALQDLVKATDAGATEPPSENPEPVQH